MDLPSQSPIFPLAISGMIIREWSVLPPPARNLDQWDNFHWRRDWRDRISTLRSCSLTCRGWHRYAQPLLFHTIYAETNEWWYRAINTLSVIVREKPELGRLVSVAGH
ncbi:hypothetical protein K474DRAFT_79090 [Panus rudis PR-1116 ss-1]|nr:hypothetical protein K474DRAFT_79090 [Panus rudis PR-1116 ss-1]